MKSIVKIFILLLVVGSVSAFQFTTSVSAVPVAATGYDGLAVSREQPNVALTAATRVIRAIGVVRGVKALLDRSPNRVPQTLELLPQGALD